MHTYIYDLYVYGIYVIFKTIYQYDMQYIAKLDFKTMSKKQRDLMHYYLFNRTGINNPNHIEILEDIYKGEPIKNYNIVSNLIQKNQLKIVDFLNSIC